MAIIIATIITQISSYDGGYDSRYRGGGGYDTGSALGSLAVLSNQRINFIPVPSQANIQPTTVYADSISGPVNIVYRSSSSPVNIQHQHSPLPGTFRQTQSVDEPHRHVHTVTKPIIQEVREIIAPQRIIRQQVLPVQEEIQTQVARATGIAEGTGNLGSGGLVGSGGFVGGDNLIGGGGLGAVARPVGRERGDLIAGTGRNGLVGIDNDSSVLSGSFGNSAILGVRGGSIGGRVGNVNFVRGFGSGITGRLVNNLNSGGIVY